MIEQVLAPVAGVFEIPHPCTSEQRVEVLRGGGPGGSIKRGGEEPGEISGRQRFTYNVNGPADASIRR